MRIIVESRRKLPKTLEKNYPNALILDLTSKAAEPWVKFSPFYPLEGIPIPFSEGQIGVSVEGIWQGLKVFETEGVNLKKLEIKTMKGLKRTVRKFGMVLGHQKGLGSKELLPYIEARKQIYAPMYLWVLENKLQQEVQQLKKLAQEYDTIVLLDYETNGEINDPSKPLSHAFLVKHYLDDNFPI